MVPIIIHRGKNGLAVLFYRPGLGIESWNHGKKKMINRLIDVCAFFQKHDVKYLAYQT